MEKDMLCVHELFKKQVEQTPEEVAVVDGKNTFTYGELDRITDSLAGYFQGQGVRFDDSVGILMEKCADYIIACIAALKAGGAYLPLDMAYPEAFLSKILHETKSKVIVTKSQYTDRLDPTIPAKILATDVDSSWKDSQSNKDAVSDISPGNLAYVVYSSGTTGEPKGILAPHRGSVHSYFERYKISSYKPGDRVACNVFFVWEIFRPLLKGATVHVIPDDVIYDPKHLANFIAENKITEVLFTPSLLETVLNSIDRQVLRSKLSSLDVMWLNGEVVTTRLKNRALETLPEHIRLLNTYSISECHDVASLDLKDSEDLPSGICPVGYPIQGITIKLLDESMEEVSEGEAGELYIGGPCLARGYLNKPELTSERFVRLGNERFYRTGDLAFILPDGNLEIRGRCDFMVKIRGYSIHLGAVETALLEHANVKSCSVISEGEEGEDKRLVAYVVKDEHADWTINSSTGTCVELRDRLKPHLAEYMIPNIYVELDELPLNPTTGKLNHKLLPPPPRRDEYDVENIQLSEAAPKEEQKRAMTILWERILSLEEGTMQEDSNFFDFGGHSLLAVKLTIFIEKIFNAQVTVKNIYEYPSVTSLVDYINDGVVEVPQQTSIREDAKLSLKIVPSSTKKPLALSEAKSIFLTGATGFLGAFLLEKILRATGDHVQIHCLTRSKSGDETDALNRIIDNLKSYGLWEYTLKERINPVVGDLTEEYLGLTETYFNQLSMEIDFIFHCAAFVNYVYTYPVLKSHTVDGTQEILRLASTTVSKPLHYISTNGIFPGGDETPYKENNDIDSFLDRLENGYGQAKWVAEKLVWEAVARGLPVCLFRPGNIGHHSITGTVNPNDFQFLIIDACTKIKCAPDNDNWAFEMTPVDFLVKAIVRFASGPSHFGQVYNIVQSLATPARAIFDLLLSKKLISEYVSVDLWISRLNAKAKETDDYILSVLAESLSDVEQYLTDDSIYDCSQFNRAIKDSRIDRPLTNKDYFEKLVKITYES
jgi:amino acid adenylation domain-containing protein/thioester reductase-like protein